MQFELEEIIIVVDVQNFHQHSQKLLTDSSFIVNQTSCQRETRGVSHTVWPCRSPLKSILRQTKNYENSNILPCRNIIFKKSSKKHSNPSRYYNSITNLKFQHKPKYQLSKNPPILIHLLPRGQNPLSYYTL